MATVQLARKERISGVYAAGLLIAAPLAVSVPLYSWKFGGFSSGEIFIYPILCGVATMLWAPLYAYAYWRTSEIFPEWVKLLAVGLTPSLVTLLGWYLFLLGNRLAIW